MKACLSFALMMLLLSCGDAKKEGPLPAVASEQHRPLIHFTPQKAWMNDPSGMVYLNGTYHLFYQYYPDSLGYIFSGSAVVDAANTSGFGRDGKAPLVAIFTQHDPKGEKQGKVDFQNQSIAYSLDEGKTWTKYAGNPVLKNPGIKDFRDPNVSWNEAAKNWLMTLAAKDRIAFYSSPDLKSWKRESEFGKNIGAHGGVWECPDLFPLDDKGEKVWVLLVSINPGGPNGGSATQYFTGRFDGRSFTPFDTVTRWIDYGPDDYAGVTWSNTGRRKIFLGWMGNWQYAQLVPTAKWRSAMTLPRELHLEKEDGKYLLSSKPVDELSAITGKPTVFQNVEANDKRIANIKLNGAAQLDLHARKAESFSVTLSNNKGQKVVIGYNKPSNQYYIDRAASGKVSFKKEFSAKHIAPRLSAKNELNFTLVIDVASVELFADNGLTVMTAIFFPDENYSHINLQSPANFALTSLSFAKLKPAVEVNSFALK